MMRMGKNFKSYVPLKLLTTIEPIAKIYSNYITAIEPVDCIYHFTDSGLGSELFIWFKEIDKGTLEYERKPYSEKHSKAGKNSVNVDMAPTVFEDWCRMVKTMHDQPSVLDKISQWDYRYKEFKTVFTEPDPAIYNSLIPINDLIRLDAGMILIEQRIQEAVDAKLVSEDVASKHKSLIDEIRKKSSDLTYGQFYDKMLRFSVSVSVYGIPYFKSIFGKAVDSLAVDGVKLTLTYQLFDVIKQLVK